MRFTYSILFIMCCTFTVAAMQDKHPAEQLPRQFQSYSATDTLSYTGEDLFEYINGGAELYLSYGLVGMQGYKYNGENLPQVTVEIYEMTSAKNAFGVFTQNRDKEESDYGQGSQSYKDFIVFWKDRYFVVINTHKPTPESQEAIAYLAGWVDKSISRTGDIPSIVHSLPKEGLVSAGYLYFHHYIWLNSYFFIADHNLLHIDEDTDAMLAKYGQADVRAYLLLVTYPDEQAATAALVGLRSKYAPEQSTANPFVRLEDSTWFTGWVKGNKLGAIFDGKTREQTEQLYKDAFTNM